MLITGVEVAGVGRFRERVRLVGLGPGVNVLAEANEAGKSTLFRAIRACFFHRHDTTQKEVRELASLDAQVPAEVAVGFRLGGHEYRIAKSFVRGTTASLQRDGREIASGRSANEVLWEVLGLAPGSGRTIDEAAFGLLWVGQQRSFAWDAPSEAAARNLTQVIASEIGGLVGGERARAVLAKTREALREVETDAGRPRGPLKQALDQLETLRRDEADVAARLAELDQAFRDLAAARSDLGRQSDPTIRGHLEGQLKAAQEALALAEAAADRLARQELEQRAAAERLQAVEARRERLLAAAERVAEARRDLADLAAELARAEAETAMADERLAEAVRQVEAVEEARGRLTAERETLAALGRAIDVARQRERLAERRHEARGLVERAAEIAAELAGLRITPALLQRIDEADRRAASLQDRRETAAARLSIVLAPDAAGKVLVNGAPIETDESRKVLERLTIALAGVAEITILPPASEAELAAELGEARRALARLLAEAAVASPYEARESLQRRTVLTREGKDVETRLQRLAAPGQSGDAGLAVFDAEIARAAGEVAAALTQAGRTDLPAPEALEAERTALAEREAALAAERARHRADLDQARSRAAAAQGRTSELKGRRQALEQGLAAALKGAPDETRDALLATCEAELATARDEHREAEAASARLRAEAPGKAAIEDLRRRVERLTQALVNHDESRAQLQEHVARLEGGILAAGGDGLGERLAALTAAREIAERDVTRASEAAASLRLLRDMIERGLAEGRERFVAPVKTHLRPLIDAVFPRAEIDLGDGFVPSRLTRERGGEAFDCLSDGTREQIAVLVRLALGTMLAGKGRPCPVILDDALVFSDDDRIERMFDALARAAEQQQLIVLTCRSRAFRSLGGRVLRIEPMS